jgi:hypothetical protein
MTINQLLAEPRYNGCSIRGAQMGRSARINGDGPLHLAYVRFVDGDYDLGGAYWGSPADLYCAWSDDEMTMIFVRASSRAEAKIEVAAYVEERTGESFSVAYSWIRQ